MTITLAACGGGGSGSGSGGETGTTEATGTGTDTAEPPTTSGDSEGMTTGEDPCPLLPATVDSDLTVGPGCVRLDRTEVVGGATLTLAPGTEVMVLPGGYLNVGPFGDNSALVSEGGEDTPTSFRSIAAAPAAGDWQCVRIGPGSAASRITNTTFDHGGAACAASGDNPKATLDIHAPMAAFSRNEVRESAGHGVLLRDAGLAREFAGNLFASNALASLRVAPAAVLYLDPGQSFLDSDDLIEVEGTFDSIKEVGTWSYQSVPYRLLNYVQIGKDGAVTIEAGTVIQLDGSSLEAFAGELRVAGTADAPVIFTSAEASPQPGDWGCLLYTSTTSPPRIEHAIFEYAGNGIGCSGAAYKAALAGPDTMQITGSTFREIAGVAIRSSACNPAWCDNTFEGVDPIFECNDAPMCM